jgi:hypothetical protein
VRRILLEMPQGSEIQEKNVQETPSFPPFVEKVLDEVRLTLRYYRNQFPGETISKVYIFGDGLKPELLPLLTKELNIPVTLPDLSKLVGQAEPVPPRLARTIGLALKELAAEGPDIELLPAKEKAASFRQSKLFKTLLLEGVGAIAVLFVIFMILSHYITLQKSSMEKGRDKTMRAPVASVSKGELEKKKTALSQKVKFYEALFDKRIYWTRKLNLLGTILPKGAWVTHLRLEDHSDEETGRDDSIYRLTLKGSVYAPEKTEELKVPSQFLSELQQDAQFYEGFNEAKLTSVRRDTVEDVSVTSFEIVLTGYKKLEPKLEPKKTESKKTEPKKKK